MYDVFEQIQRQKRERNLLQREIEGEEKYLHVLAMTYKETCISEIGKQESRSIAGQVNRWIGSMKEKEKQAVLLFVNLDKAFDKFKKYVLDKYENKKEQLARFEELFRIPDYRNDCKRIIIHKIYDFKLEQSIKYLNEDKGFASGRAANIAALNQEKKNIRKSAHEGMNRVYKTLNGPKLPDDLEAEIYRIFERVVTENITPLVKGTHRDLRLVKSDQGNLLN